MKKVTEKWLNERKKGVGGSDVADVLSLAPYGCAARLWDEKRSLAPDFEQKRNPNMERGVMLEDIACEIYANQTGLCLTEVRAFKSEKHPFMLGNVDRLITITEKHKNAISDKLQGRESLGILEVKCPNRDNFTRIKRIGLPEAYILQMQHYLYVADKKWGEWGIFCADLWELLPIPVERDDELVEMIIEREERFWIQVENGPRPERLEWGDKRCKDCIRRLACWAEKWEELDEEEEDAEDEYIERYDDEFIDACVDHKENIEMFKDAELIFEESKAKLIEILGDQEKVKCDEAKISYKWGSKTYVDKDRLKFDNPELAKKYEYDTLVRPFRFFGGND